MTRLQNNGWMPQARLPLLLGSQRILDKLMPGLQDILGIFQAYGSVKELRVLPGPPGSEGHSSAGALVRMGSSEEAARAIAGVNAWAAATGTGNGTFPLSVKYADSPEERAR